MPDTNPACRTAFRSNSEIVHHPSGTLSGITPECCPPSVRNRVRHGAERAVVKVRGSNHSHELREFTIDGTGIVIGDMLPNEEGLLGGRPTKKRSADLRDHGSGTHDA
jgi:hypothetical protein